MRLGELFLTSNLLYRVGRESIDLLVTDAQILGGMNGLFSHLIEKKCKFPVIVYSGMADRLFDDFEITYSGRIVPVSKGGISLDRVAETVRMLIGA